MRITKIDGNVDKIDSEIYLNPWFLHSMQNIRQCFRTATVCKIQVLLMRHYRYSGRVTPGCFGRKRKNRSSSMKSSENMLAERFLGFRMTQPTGIRKSSRIPENGDKTKCRQKRACRIAAV